jgi:hypothetical protein
VIRDPGRTALATAVAACRRILLGKVELGKIVKPGDIGEQLEAPYGFDKDTGAPKPMEQMTHLRAGHMGPARMLRAWHAHLRTVAAGKTDAERTRAAYDQMRNELGYTALHRLCALRMAEERGIVRTCVREGISSESFRAWHQFAGPTLGTAEEAYSIFLDRLYDDLAVDLPAVFDRRAAASLVAPSPRAIPKLISVLGSIELLDLWREDTTLGWMFEDWNDDDERTEMRKHDAPRNARELAVRNQFFTPRWVVEFLTENTLGRWWLERTGEDSALADTNRHRFLLPPSERRPERPDPRDIRVLDPACGSGHFLLYAYDLLERIYVEAWERQEHRSPGRRPLWEEWPDLGAFVAELPRLILENNLYGVDIDPRCVQEGALALWLRAQKSWEDRGVKPRARPRVRKVNLVCAQALGGEPKAKAALLAGLKPAVLGRLVDALFAKAGEMGLLLRVETALAETVAQVKEAYLGWKREERMREGELFPTLAGPKQATIQDFAALREMGDEAFWGEAETRLAEALGKLVEDATEDRFGTRLFADDVRHGLEFFDLARMRFDVVLMNPPFGDPSEGTKKALVDAYPLGGKDLYAMFMQRGLEMLREGGRVGAITNRTWIALDGFQNFRERVIGPMGGVEVAADLGSFVLNALVETAAVVLAKGVGPDDPATWFRLVRTSTKDTLLATSVDASRSGGTAPVIFRSNAARFASLPASVYAYWISEGLISTFARGAPISRRGVDVMKGAESSDHTKELRVAWEIPATVLGPSGRWLRLAKGGEYRPFWDDIHLVIRLRHASGEIVRWRRGKLEWFDRRGVTWPHRTSSRLSMRALPASAAFSNKGPTAVPLGSTSATTLLCLLGSSPAFIMLATRLGAADSAAKSYELDPIREIRWPVELDASESRMSVLANDGVALVRSGQIEDDESGETVVAFSVPPVLLPLPDGHRPAGMTEAVCSRVAAREERVGRLAAIQAEIDEIVADAYGFTERDRQVMDEELEPPLHRLSGTEPINPALFTQAYLTKEALDGENLPGGADANTDIRVEHRRGKQVRLRDEATLCRLFQAPPSRIAATRRELGLLRDSDRARAAADIVSWAVGVAFGRFDVRLMAHPEWIPTFRDAFAALPTCPLGQLVTPDGLPATADRLASEAWLAARAALPVPELPPEPEFPAITSTAYPLDVAWDGLLVEDPLLHDQRTSFADRVSRVLGFVFGAGQGKWEEDIANALDVADIATWLRSPIGFFDDHLGRYTKSRRSAPIYWPLALGSVTYWVYAPRFDRNTVPALLVRLRVSTEELRRRRDRVTAEAASDPGKNGELAKLRAEITEREGMHARLSKLLADGYQPHPDDGFAVTAAPLHFAFRLPRWRDLLKATWNELEKGDLDWAHLAMALWPKRVRSKCLDYDVTTDPPTLPSFSLASAHGLEEEHLAAVVGKNFADKAAEVRKPEPRRRGRKKAESPPGEAAGSNGAPEPTPRQVNLPGMAPPREVS